MERTPYVSIIIPTHKEQFPRVRVILRPDLRHRARDESGLT